MSSSRMPIRFWVYSCALMLCANVAVAASNVSPRFDGTYAGIMEPAPGLSQPDCKSVTITSFVVKQGAIQRSTVDPVSFDGFVTDEGFVTGHAHLVGGATVVFEGRIDGTTLSAGAVDHATGCDWVATFERK